MSYFNYQKNSLLINTAKIYNLWKVVTLSSIISAWDPYVLANGLKYYSEFVNSQLVMPYSQIAEFALSYPNLVSFLASLSIDQLSSLTTKGIPISLLNYYQFQFLEKLMPFLSKDDPQVIHLTTDDPPPIEMGILASQPFAERLPFTPHLMLKQK